LVVVMRVTPFCLKTSVLSADGFAKGGFTLSGISGQTVMVEVCTNLATANWTPVQTNTLGNSATSFSAPI
jgi:hypothetical protein